MLVAACRQLGSRVERLIPKPMLYGALVVDVVPCASSVLQRGGDLQLLTLAHQQNDPLETWRVVGVNVRIAETREERQKPDNAGENHSEFEEITD